MVGRNRVGGAGIGQGVDLCLDVAGGRPEEVQLASAGGDRGAQVGEGTLERRLDEAQMIVRGGTLVGPVRVGIDQGVQVGRRFQGQVGGP